MSAGCHFQFLLRLAAFALVVILGSDAGIFADEAAATLAETALSNRKNIETIYLRVLLTDDNDLLSSTPTEPRLELHVWNDFLRDVHRCDRHARLKDGKELARNVVGWQCGFEQTFLDYSDPVDDRLAIVRFVGNGDQNLLPKMHMLGMVATGVKELGVYDASGWLWRVSRGVTKSPDDELRTELVSLEFEEEMEHLRAVVFTENNRDEGDHQNSGTKVKSLAWRVIFDTNKGASVVYTDIRYDLGNMVVADSTRSFLQNWQGYWYPERIRTERRIDGRIESVENVAIDSVRINERENFHSLVSMEIAPGSLVVGAPGYTAGGYIWDGTKISPVDIAPILAPPLRERARGSSGRRPYTALWINGVVILVIVCCIIWLQKRATK
jgi:hypothetical protein